MGYELISFLKTSQMAIANGRLGQDRGIGKLTCKNASVVDYVILSYDLFHYVSDFCVMDFNEMCSDVHCALNVVFKITPCDLLDPINVEPRDVSSDRRTFDNRVKWDASVKTQFIDNIDDDAINRIDARLKRLTEQDTDIQLDDIDGVMNDTCDIFIRSARKTNMVKIKRRSKKRILKPKSKPWFNSACRSKRSIFFKARRKDIESKARNRQTNATKTERKNAAKLYKKTVKKSYKDFESKIFSHLRNLKVNNPKAYWDYLNKAKGNNKNSTNVPTCEEFANMFKDLGSDINGGQENDTDERHINFLNYIDIHIYCRDTSRLDSRITIDEVKEAIHCLKPGKSHGLDLITNEFLKSAPDKLKQTIVTIFNLVLDTGIIPSSWSLGVICPIYKNKGDRGDPNNYRGITILSCLGKLFTCVLNKRLGIFIDNYNILGAEQTGFRKGFSTLDHLFTFYGIVDVLLSKRKRLYCAFLDYEKAFDKVNRAFLWQKLLSENVQGKILTVV